MGNGINLKKNPNTVLINKSNKSKNNTRNKMVSLSSSNTKRKVRPRKRAWLITLNEPEKFEEIKKYLKKFTNFNYAIACKEKAPTTDSHIDKLLTKMHPAARKLCFQVLFERLRLFCQNSQDTH